MTSTILRVEDIQQRMQCTGNIAHNIEDAFVTVEQLIEAIESDTPLTDTTGIGPQTASAITDWYENREQREEHANEATVTRTSNTSLTVTLHTSWEPAINTNEPTPQSNAE